MKNKIRAVLFDWAGTVVDFGSWAPVLVFLKVFHSRGIDLEVQQVRKPMGMSKREHICELLRLPEVRQAWILRYGREVNEEDVDHLYDDFLVEQKRAIDERKDLLPGVVDTVQALCARGIRVGSTTGYSRELMGALVESAEQEGFKPECVITATDVHAGRPAPWMIYRACEALGVYPMQQVINVDDTVAGVKAALSAGCWSIGVSRTGNLVGMGEHEFKSLSMEEQDKYIAHAEGVLKEAGAHFVIGSVAELHPVIEQINSRLVFGNVTES